jgi:hypothetical protein
MKLKNIAAALGVAGGMLLAGQAQALLLDDMAFTGPLVEAADATPADGGVTVTPRNTGGSGLWVTARDSLFANLVSGDTIRTQDCPNCMVSHTDNAPSSIGHQYWSWANATAVDVDSVSFDYETDIAGADFFLTLTLGGTVVAQQQFSDVGATGLTLAPPPLVNAQTLTLAYQGLIDDARIDVISAGGTYTDPTGVLGTVDVGNDAIGLDVNINNLQAAVPLPGTLAMLGLGLAGLGWQRRRAA